MSDNDYVEDINEIIGAIPPWVMRCGVTTIIISFLLILCALIFVQLPQTISGDASIIILKFRICETPLFFTACSESKSLPRGEGFREGVT